MTKASFLPDDYVPLTTEEQFRADLAELHHYAEGLHYSILGPDGTATQMFAATRGGEVLHRWTSLDILLDTLREETERESSFDEQRSEIAEQMVAVITGKGPIDVDKLYELRWQYNVVFDAEDLAIEEGI